MTPEQPTSVPPGWYPDPHGVAELRWWDGADWTDHLHNTAAPVETIEPAVAEPAVSEPAVVEPAAAEPADVVPVNPVPAAVDPALDFPPPAYHPPGQVEDDFGTPVFDLDYEPTPAAAEFSQPPLPQEQPVSQEQPLSQDLDAAHEAVPDEPSPMHDLFSVATPVEEAATAPVWSATTPPANPEPNAPSHAAPVVEPAEAEVPQLPEPVAAEPAPVTDPNRLPSRRELRERGEVLAEPLPVHDAPVHETPVFDLSEQQAAPAVAPAQPAPAFDTSVPTSFDWTADAPIAPSEPDSAENPDPAPSSAPAFSASPTPDPVASAPATLTPEPMPLPTQAMPDSAAAAAWGTQDAPSVPPVIETPLPTLRSSTISGWLIASMPLIAGFLSLGAVKGAENYPRYAPAGVSWWMLVVGVLVILYLVTVVLAVADRRRLDSFGHGAPAHWAWAFATAPVYLIMRMLAVMRETGRMTSQLWVWIILTLALVGAYFATMFLAPNLVSAYTLQFL